MLNQLKPEDCIGHTVRYAEKYCEYILLVFDHGYLAYGAWEKDEMWALRPLSIDDIRINFGERAIAAGVFTQFTQVENDEMVRVINEKWRAWQDLFDRQNYERLKAKFEGR